MDFYTRRGDFVDEGNVAPALLDVRMGSEAGASPRS
jgi:hypothetical protein